MYKHKEAAEPRTRIGLDDLKKAKNIMSHTIHNEGCRYASVQQEKIIKASDRFMQHAMVLTGAVLLGGIVYTQAPAPFWATVTAFATWEALTFYFKRRKVNTVYVRVKDTRQHKELEDQGKEVVTISLKEWDVFTTIENGVTRQYFEKKEVA
jgi:hypothetical protein